MHGAALADGELDDEVARRAAGRRRRRGGGPCPCRPSAGAPGGHRLPGRGDAPARFADREPAAVLVVALGDERRLLGRGTRPACSGSGRRSGSPVGGSARSGGRPGMTRSRVSWVSSMLRDRLEQRLGVRHPRLLNSAAVGAFSTTWPAYITMISSVRPATTPRSWVTRIIAIARCRCCACSRSRICACTVTSSAVVGSSAMSSSGPHDERHGDGDPLAHPARQLVRVLVEPALGLGDVDRPQQLDRRAAGPRSC